jgi:hypothetical protein
MQECFGLSHKLKMTKFKKLVRKEGGKGGENDPSPPRLVKNAMINVSHRISRSFRLAKTCISGGYSHWLHVWHK